MGHGRDGFGTTHLRFVGFLVLGAVPRPFGPLARPMNGSRTNKAVSSFQKKIQFVQSLIQLIFVMSHISSVYTPYGALGRPLNNPLLIPGYPVRWVRRNRRQLK